MSRQAHLVIVTLAVILGIGAASMHGYVYGYKTAEKECKK